MATEIYFNQELSDISFEIEALEEWKKINEELGMEKQLSLTKGKASPQPYPYMNESMQRVYETLCPRKVEYKEYDKTPIPLDVLKQIAYSVKEKHFNKIQIWYDDKTPDPIVVGFTNKFHGCDNKGGYYRDEKERVKIFDSKEELLLYRKATESREDDKSIYETDINEFIIARWGDVLRPYKELVEIAKDRLVELYSNDMQKYITELTQKLKVIKENSSLYLMGEISLSELKGNSRW